MTTSITLISSAMEIHRTGCGDIARALAKGRTKHGDADRAWTFTGDTPAGAITALDTELASWFGEKPYTESSRENGCWSWGNCRLMPCLKAIHVNYSETGAADV